MRPSAFVLCGSAVLGLALLVLAVPGWAQDTPKDRATLKGIQALQVVVEETPEAERDGPPKAQLEAEIESRLRHAGIPVMRSANSVLYVSVTAAKSDAGQAYPYVLSATVEQPVQDPRNPESLRPCATWGLSRFGTVEAARLPTVRSDVAALVERFINAYLEQNPKR